MAKRKFNKEDILSACFEGQSEDGNLILVYEDDMELDGGLIALEDQKAYQEFILQAKDNGKFYSHVMFWYVERLEENDEVELLEVKKKRKTITVWEAVED